MPDMRLRSLSDADKVIAYLYIRLYAARLTVSYYHKKYEQAVLMIKMTEFMQILSAALQFL